VIFFSTFAITFNTFNARNGEFGDDLTVMNISRILQSNSYVTGLGDFTSHCREIGTVNLKFAAFISNDGTSGALSKEELITKNIFNVNFYRNSQGKFLCTNTGVSGAESVSDMLSIDEAAKSTVVSRIFPIAVEDEKVVKPMHLFVVAWK